MARAQIVWQARGRDDVVNANLIDQLMRTAASKQVLMRTRYTSGRYEERQLDEFSSHLLTLYELSLPLIKLDKNNFKKAFDNGVKKSKRVPELFELYTSLISALNAAGVWNISKIAKLDEVEQGFRAVRGV